MTMRTRTDDVREFHEEFELTYDGPPRSLAYENDDELRATLAALRFALDTAGGIGGLLGFRIAFLIEELAEYVEGVIVDDRAKQADALIDLEYVSAGTAYLQGFPHEEIWRAVHAANMQKERATTATASARGGTLDIVKPDGWQPPNVAALLMKRELEMRVRRLELTQVEIKVLREAAHAHRTTAEYGSALASARAKLNGAV